MAVLLVEVDNAKCLQLTSTTVGSFTARLHTASRIRCTTVAGSTCGTDAMPASEVAISFCVTPDAHFAVACGNKKRSRGS